MYNWLTKIVFIGFLGFNTGLLQGVGAVIPDFAVKRFSATIPEKFDLFNNFPVARKHVIGLYKKSGTEDRNKALTVLLKSNLVFDPWVHVSNEEEASKQKIHLYAILAGREVDAVLPVSAVSHIVMNFLLNAVDFCNPERAIASRKLLQEMIARNYTLFPQ